MKNPPAFINSERETRSFFWFMTLVLSGMYVWVVATQPEVRQPLRLALFTVLMNAHIILHWMLRGLANSRSWIVVYLLVQGILALALSFISANIGLTFSLFMALVGESIGVYGITRRGFLAASYYLALSLGTYVTRFGIAQVGWWLLGTIPLFVFVVLYVEMYSRQINTNERARRLLGEIETANRQLAAYAAQVEDLTIAAERQRMARELHDTLSQGLAGLILQLEAVDAHLQGGRPEKARQIVQHSMESARATLDGARRAIDDLRDGGPVDLEEALRSQVSHFIESSGISCSLELDLPAGMLDGQCDLIVRTVAEALSNIARHASATQAYVRLEAQAGSLALVIGDNGKGFDPAAVPVGHYGLVGMRERARLAGGSLDIESNPGRGTTLTVHIPVS